MLFRSDAVRGPEFTAQVRAAINNREEFLPPPTTVEEIRRRWGIADPEDQSWVLPRLCPQSVAAFAQPLRLGSFEAQEISRSFILSSESGFDPIAKRVRQSGWGLYQLDTCQDRKSTRLNSSHALISYAVFCLK